MANTITQSTTKASNDLLSDLSPRDKPWDVHRAQCDQVNYLYAAASEFERLAKRMADCSGLLSFAWVNSNETGETSLKLRSARFCRVRHCPVCQWRRSLMWQARFYQSLPSVIEQYPTSRFLFLTLTVRNCDIKDLRSTLKAMNAAWQRLIKRKEFSSVTGWLRATEVTRGKDDTAHPHFHALLMVPSSYFKKTYVRHDQWAESWRASMRLDYLPNVDIRTVKKRKPKDGQLDAFESYTVAEELNAAVSETLKYAVKPDDMTEGSPDWFLELTRQTYKLRFIATGGALKNILRLDQESDQDLALQGITEALDDEEGQAVRFAWRGSEKRYKRTQ